MKKINNHYYIKRSLNNDSEQYSVFNLYGDLIGFVDLLENTLFISLIDGRPLANKNIKFAYNIFANKKIRIEALRFCSEVFDAHFFDCSSKDGLIRINNFYLNRVYTETCEQYYIFNNENNIVLGEIILENGILCLRYCDRFKKYYPKTIYKTFFRNKKIRRRYLNRCCNILNKCLKTENINVQKNSQTLS